LLQVYCGIKKCRVRQKEASHLPCPWLINDTRAKGSGPSGHTGVTPASCPGPLHEGPANRPYSGRAISAYRMVLARSTTPTWMCVACCVRVATWRMSYTMPWRAPRLYVLICGTMQPVTRIGIICPLAHAPPSACCRDGRSMHEIWLATAHTCALNAASMQQTCMPVLFLSLLVWMWDWLYGRAHSMRTQQVRASGPAEVPSPQV